MRAFDPLALSQVGCGLSLPPGFLPDCPPQSATGAINPSALVPDVSREFPASSCVALLQPARYSCSRTRPRKESEPGTRRPDHKGGTSGAVDPCGNFSGTSSLKFRGTKGSIGHTFMVCIHTENQNQGNFYPFVLLEISVLHESPLGHLRYGLTDVPPQPNSPPDNVINPDQPRRTLTPEIGR